MFYLRLLCLMIAGAAFAQSVSPAAPKPHKPAVVDDDDDDDDAPTAPAAKVSSLPAQTAVITITGICNDKPRRQVTRATQNRAACETIVTRAEFESLTNAVQSGMSVEKQRQFGDAYANLQIMSEQAGKLGLDKTEHFEQLLKFARAQILAQELERYLQNKAARISTRDIDNYYQDNPSLFERASFRRVFIPHRRAGAAGASPDIGASAGSATTEDPIAAEAQALWQRASVGEDLDLLQQVAFTDAGLKGTAPTAMAAVRPADLPSAHRSAFSLSPGELSQVIADSTGFYIYKMINKEKLPLSAVSQEIAEYLQKERLNKLRTSLRTSASIRMNEAYFDPSPEPSADQVESGGKGNPVRTESALQLQRH